MIKNNWFITANPQIDSSNGYSRYYESITPNVLPGAIKFKWTNQIEWKWSLYIISIRLRECVAYSIDKADIHLIAFSVSLFGLHILVHKGDSKTAIFCTPPKRPFHPFFRLTLLLVSSEIKELVLLVGEFMTASSQKIVFMLTSLFTVMLECALRLGALFNSCLWVHSTKTLVRR